MAPFVIDDERVDLFIARCVRETDDFLAKLVPALRSFGPCKQLLLEFHALDFDARLLAGDALVSAG